MKNIIKYSLFFLVAAVSFMACSEYKDVEVPSHVEPDSKMAARFLGTNSKAIEVTPVNLETKLIVVRENKSQGYTYPITVVSDTSNVFIVPENIVFEAGKDTAEIIIALNEDAEYEVKYGIELSIDDPNNFNVYKSEVPVYKGNVMISLWDKIGISQFYDSFVLDKVVEVDFYTHTVDEGRYRVSNPYTEAALKDAEWGDDWISMDNADTFLEYIVAGEDSVLWDFYWKTGLVYQGDTDDEIWAVRPEKLGETNKSKAVRDSDDNISYMVATPYFYINGLGGFGIYSVYIGFPEFDLSKELNLPILGKEDEFVPSEEEGDEEGDDEGEDDDEDDDDEGEEDEDENDDEEDDEENNEK